MLTLSSRVVADVFACDRPASKRLPVTDVPIQPAYGLINALWLIWNITKRTLHSVRWLHLLRFYSSAPTSVEHLWPGGQHRLKIR